MAFWETAYRSSDLVAALAELFPTEREALPIAERYEIERIDLPERMTARELWRELLLRAGNAGSARALVAYISERVAGQLAVLVGTLDEKPVKALPTALEPIVKQSRTTKPELIARFALGEPDRKGHRKPRQVRITKNGWLHYVILLQLRNAPADTRRVKYELDETFDEPIRRVTSPPRFLEEVQTYGDFDVHVTLEVGKRKIALHRELVEMLRAGHSGEYNNRHVDEAIEDLLANQD